MTKYESFYPPVSMQGPVSGRWYIIANGFHEVDRKYEWAELEKMWIPTMPISAKSNKPVHKSYKVKGSKGKVYTIVNDADYWTCSCPAHGFGRGKDCKHITAIKSKP